MVSQPHAIHHVVHNRPSRPASRSRISVAGTLAVFFLLLAAGMPLADGCTTPEILAIGTNPGVIFAGSDATLIAGVRGCVDCSYTWTITPATCDVRTQTFEGATITYPFKYAADYNVHLVVVEHSQPECDPTFFGTVVSDKTVGVSGTRHGYDGVCCDPGSVDIIQSSESSELGSTPPIFRIATSPKPCDDCVYTWSLYKTSDEIFADPVPLEPGDVFAQNMMTHRFTEAGRYKINVRKENPPICMDDPIGGYYASMTVNHRVTDPAAIGGQPAIPDVMPATVIDAPAAVTT